MSLSGKVPDDDHDDNIPLLERGLSSPGVHIFDRPLTTGKSRSCSLFSATSTTLKGNTHVRDGSFVFSAELESIALAPTEMDAEEANKLNELKYSYFSTWAKSSLQEMKEQEEKGRW
ncbi:hypothetical protein PoB_006834000 [Plakobranchus ocellatus]|uniref:Uncharacterized protein n=1 Tax=Plakobranchus ocellatus TaxID=259542 RepID=A0AAV4DD10_9GAST|nr:hypothetical protein PoB_006834000 [Plakobranchus ocellatus]